MSFVATVPAPTTAHEPIFSGATQTDPAPIDAPVLISTPTFSQSAEDLIVKSTEAALGYLSFVRITPGPIKTPSCTTAES